MRGLSSDDTLQWRSQRGSQAGPRLFQMPAVSHHVDCKRFKYSNKAIKYSIKAVSMSGCALLTYPVWLRH